MYAEFWLVNKKRRCNMSYIDIDGGGGCVLGAYESTTMVIYFCSNTLSKENMGEQINK
jgi:hypothetical protein